MHLAVYVVEKEEKFTTRADCLGTLTGSCNVATPANLTNMLSYVPGALQQPSSALTCLLSGIDDVIEVKTPSKMVFGDPF